MVARKEPQVGSGWVLWERRQVPGPRLGAESLGPPQGPPRAAEPTPAPRVKMPLSLLWTLPRAAWWLRWLKAWRQAVLGVRDRRGGRSEQSQAGWAWVLSRQPPQGGAGGLNPLACSVCGRAGHRRAGIGKGEGRGPGPHPSPRARLDAPRGRKVPLRCHPPLCVLVTAHAPGRGPGQVQPQNAGGALGHPPWTLPSACDSVPWALAPALL